ncbi:hypothetical protein LEP1GSC193_2531 [Leptospira alstonii serovar Pingchang str. 80-412]|uniref:Uncharacterized protein n=2 Tax=Leptospira alstonii TaxID=28452 RepID=M6DI11_9LEPT|nr:hypothetical protein LEP1GSC194_2570 [Leptospira alstonii serovar Sichuan str. 79601]EQA80930.1 hypothetical protein LEP1GSC193_2531 [Leptospira alstonii serovar Pingchang str. 80-412]
MNLQRTQNLILSNLIAENSQLKPSSDPFDFGGSIDSYINFKYVHLDQNNLSQT